MLEGLKPMGSLAQRGEFKSQLTGACVVQDEAGNRFIIAKIHVPGKSNMDTLPVSSTGKSRVVENINLTLGEYANGDKVTIRGNCLLELKTPVKVVEPAVKASNVPVLTD
jgi:hypothetical protein